MQKLFQNSMLSAEKITKKYHQRAVVDGISLSVREGEIVGLLGPNGAGKTTTFRMIVGLISPDAGSIYLNQQNITDLPMYLRVRAGLGYLAQEPAVFSDLTVADNLLAVLEYLEPDKSRRLQILENTLGDFNLLGLRKSLGRQLSGGERRRLEVARVLLHQPKFLLLDEPFVGIDPITVADIQKMIVSIRQKGIGVLITDHNVRETLAIIDRAYIIYSGRILVEGPAEVLLNDSRVRQIYLGENFR